MFSSKEEFLHFCEEIAKQTSDRYTLVVFQDRSVAHVTGPWVAQKPVWCSFEGEFSPKEVFDALYEAHENENGVPCPPYPAEKPSWLKMPKEARFIKGILQISSWDVDILGEDGRTYPVEHMGGLQREYPIRYRHQEGVPTIWRGTWGRVSKVTINKVEIPNGAEIEFCYR